jgi:hypothetical protein
MKIYPDITKVWGKKIREAGMTKNQAKRVFDENEKTQKVTQDFIENPPTETNKKSSIQGVLKKLNIF